MGIDMEYVKEYWGITEYYKNGVLHRDGDLPAVFQHEEIWNIGKMGNVTVIMVRLLYERPVYVRGIKTAYI